MRNLISPSSGDWVGVGEKLEGLHVGSIVEALLRLVFPGVRGMAKITLEASG